MYVMLCYMYFVQQNIDKNDRSSSSDGRNSRTPTSSAGPTDRVVRRPQSRVRPRDVLEERSRWRRQSRQAQDFPHL